MTSNDFADRLDAIHADLHHAMSRVRLASDAVRYADKAADAARRDRFLAEAQHYLAEACEAHDRAGVLLGPQVSDTVADALPADTWSADDIRYLREGGWMDQDGNPR